MGNCMWRMFSAGKGQAVMVVTSTGGIMEFHAPVTAEHITSEFPGYGIFRRRQSSSPLLHNESLEGGHLYYLLPLDHLRGPSEDENAGQMPYRMSLDGNILGRWRRAGAELQKTKSLSGVWKVRLVISPEQLSRILAEESHTQLLVESGRTVAKCGSGDHPASSSDARSSSSGRRDSERDL